MYGNAQVTQADAPAKRQPEVQAEIDGLNRNFDELFKQVEYLEDRLQPVLAQRKDEGQTGTGAPEPVRVPLAEVLCSSKRHVAAIGTRIASIIERLEV